MKQRKSSIQDTEKQENPVFKMSSFHKDDINHAGVT